MVISIYFALLQRLAKKAVYSSAAVYYWILFAVGGHPRYVNKTIYT